MAAHEVRGAPGCTRILGLPTLIVILCQFLAATATALEWEFDDVSVRFDTTLSQGITVRASDRDPALIGIANGGTANSVNQDDGTLNYDDGRIAQNVSRFTSELDIDGGALSAFFRVTGFIDWEQRNGTRARTPLTDPALDIVGERLELLDAYVSGNFDIGQAPAQLRLGNQVLSWGEGTFIPGGINVINPIDVVQFRTPGAELREALKPVAMLSGSVSATESATLEAFYQFDWKEVETDPPGTFFSTNDFVGAGGSTAFLGFGSFSDLGTDIAALVAPVPLDALNLALVANGAAPLPAFDSTFLGVARAPDEDPSDGDWGVAFRYFAEQLDGTEFGIYYVNYSSRLPIVSAKTGSAAAAQNAAITTGVALGAGVPASTAGALGVSQYAKSARYFIEYPENIDMLGASFNTALGNTGWALQGEYSWKHDAPLQVDDVELLFAGLTPLSLAVPAAFGTFSDNQVGVFGPDTVIPGFIERDVSQIQATATKIIGPTLGANSGLFAFEVGAVYVHDMPSTSEMRLNADGTSTSGNPRQAQAINPATGTPGAHAGKAAESSGDFATEWSAGLRLATSLTYNNAIGPVNLTPRLQYAWDFHGNSPQPAGPFLEGRMAINVGLTATYLQSWEADLGYTTFFGAGKQNLLNDRDFVSLTVKYSF